MERAVPNVTLALPQDLVVDGQANAEVAAGAGALHERLRDAPVRIEEELQQFRGVAGRCDVLEGARGPVAQDHQGARRRRGTGHREFARRPQQPGKTGRADDDRPAQGLPKQRDSLRPRSGSTLERTRHHGEFVEGLLVAAERDLVLRAAIHKIEHKAWQFASGQAPRCCDAVGPSAKSCSIHGPPPWCS